MTRHLTDPDCPQSVRNQINGGVTQEAPAAWQYRYKAEYRYGEHASPDWYLIGVAPDEQDLRYREYRPLYAGPISTAQADREQLEARVKSLEVDVAKWKRIATDRSYMMNAYILMLGPIGLKVAEMWARKGMQRFHADWTTEAYKMTGEERAQTILDWEAAPKREVDPREIDGDIPRQPFDAALNPEGASND